ncbi:outer membrane protein [Gymnodinialimonas hymeniacidonis]|uniref:outer membrane protein n=1 Tax=Gymnodinialimonas hymeniacidonis TaxID=3126508 RepID=UPI0034C5F89B
MLRSSLCITTLILSSPAFAGGVAPQPAPPPVIVPVPDEDWTEFYIGGQVDFVASTDISVGALDLYDLEGHLAGVFAGYRYDFGDIVVGGEIDYMVGTLEATNIAPNIFLVAPDADVTLVRVGGEVGYDAGPALIYGTAGFAHINFAFGATPDNESNGYFFGAGVDYRVAENVTVGAELLQHSFSDFGTALEFDMTTFGVNVAFTF